MAPPVLELDGAGVQSVRVKRKRRRHRKVPVFLGSQDRKQYWVFRNATAQIQRGEAVFLMDETGTRALTLMRLMAGLLPPDAGAARRRGAGLLLTRPGRRWFNSLSVGQSVRLLGGLYGMTDKQIDAREQECAQFAEFADRLWRPTDELDNAVLRQLAFAVGTAAPVRLLALDNMAVTGPPEFRPKCVPRLRELMDAGTALVVLQDDPDLISLLASRALLVKRNGLKELTADEAVALAQKWATERRNARKTSRRAMLEDDDDEDII
jgi:ABC-type polysaccharide/polyol phosphate transport system ATPase subunit